MSIDNNAILFVGSSLDDEKEAILIAKFGYDNDEDPLLVEDEDLGVVESNDGLLVGFEIGDSGSYGTLVIEDCENLIADAKKRFKKIFGEEAQVYLYNYQW